MNTNNNRGIVALITSIVVGLLLIVITSSAIAIMGMELRQATDYDQSIKAYFAAEAGVEDALAYIRREGVDVVTASDDCDIDSGGSGILGGSISYTCWLLTKTSNEVSGQLAPEETIQLDLSSIAFNRLKISWNKQGTSDPDGWNTSGIPLKFPAGDSWRDNGNGYQLPAVLEVSFISYVKNQSFDSSGIQSTTIVAKPHPSENGNTDNPGINLSPSVKSDFEPVRCVPATQVGEYECDASFQSLADRNYVVRIHSRYSGANYKVEAYQGSTLVPIPNAQLAIDVTGKAGDVLRRVRYQVPLGVQIGAFNSFVLLSDETICKVMEVTSDGHANTETGCSP